MRKIRFKWLAGVLSAALIITTLAGCGAAAALSRPLPTVGAATISIDGSCTISQSGDVITVSGTIGVMNGTVIDVSIVSQNGMVIDHLSFAKTQDTISQQFTVPADKLEGVVDMKGYISCAPSYYGQQPTDPDVYAAYGKKFENITNTENVVWNNEGIILTFESDWLNGAIPSPTDAPTPTPIPTTASTPTGSAEASATPSASTEASATPTA